MLKMTEISEEEKRQIMEDGPSWYWYQENGTEEMSFSCCAVDWYWTDPSPAEQGTETSGFRFDETTARNIALTWDKSTLLD